MATPMKNPALAASPGQAMKKATYGSKNQTVHKVYRQDTSTTGTTGYNSRKNRKHSDNKI